MSQPTPNREQTLAETFSAAAERRRERPTLPMHPTPSHPIHRQPLVEHQPGTVTVDVTYRMTIPATWKTDGPVVPFLETAAELATVIADALTIDYDDAESMGYDGTLRDGSEPVAVPVRWVRCQEIPAMWSMPEPWTEADAAGFLR